MSTTPVTQPQSSAVWKKVTTRALQQKKQRQEPISMLTAYDYPTATALDKAGIDAILVGDSVGMVVLGYKNTLPVTMEEIIHHCKAVARGAEYALLIGDMPFLSYQVSPAEAVRNAGRFLQEAGMDAVKLEGGKERVDTIKNIVSAGIPVMGHLGLTPQSIHQLGGFRPQGRDSKTARLIIEDALMLESAGCFSIVLESIPSRLAALISHRISIPTIGIGAGSGCDGQVLVTHDLLGLFDRFTPRFVKQYAHFYEDMEKAFTAYISDVKTRQFPTEEHSIDMSNEEWEELKKEINHE
jgi:3-methyl-2-oxobutanoate hydroxymethyltransferase